MYVFILKNSDLHIADQVLESIQFKSIEKSKESNLEDNKPGIVKGFLHGMRAPFAFVINIFAKNKITLFSEIRTGWYTVGYILGILSIISIIFGGSRRR